MFESFGHVVVVLWCGADTRVSDDTDGPVNPSIIGHHRGGS